MQRFLVFTFLFPPLALVVFNTPDMIAGRFSLMNFTSLLQAYVIAVFPAWLLAAVDRRLSAKPASLPIVGTTGAGMLMGVAVALVLLGGEVDEFLPVLMLGLLGAIPAAVCSWLSSLSLASKVREQAH